MQTLGPRWGVTFGTFTLGGTLKAEPLEAAIAASAEAFKIPEKPEKEVKISAPCGMFDPAGTVVAERFLDGSGNTWLGVGTRSVANSPSPALVEAEFRRLAVERFGPDWSTTKKSKLNYLRKKAKSELAARTPFRLSETGALFICLQNGDVVTVGHAGQAVARDLVGRCSELTRVDFAAPLNGTSVALLGYLRQQDESQLPWPTGTSSLSRKRGEVKESCSVKGLSWAKGSADAAALLSNAWKPVKIEVQWADRKGVIGLTGRLESVSWGGKVEASDPHGPIEYRLSRLLEMDVEVRARMRSATPEGEALLFPDDAPAASSGEALRSDG